MNEKKNLTTKETFDLAVQNHQKNNLQVAENLYKEILKTSPDHFESIFSLGTLLGQTKRFDLAKPLLQKSIQIQPNYAIAHSNLGNIQRELGEHQKAISSYEKAIQINPNYADSHYNLGLVYGELGELQKEKSCYEKAIQINPNYADVCNNLGRVLQELGEQQKAMSCFEKAIEINPSHTNALHNMLRFLYTMDDQSIFFKKLDDRIKQGEINALIGSLSSRSEIKYGIKRPNPFCEDPLKYVLKTNLTERYDFKNIFVKGVKNIIKDDMVLRRRQDLITNGYQTAGNLFVQKNDFIDKIKNIIHLEIEKYQIHFKDSKEGLIRSWPTTPNLNGWLVSMKSGGKLSAHMHEEGWVSGSVYINVPPKLKTNSGNLVVCIEDEKHTTGKNINQKKIIDVVTGSLCLFPSSLYHYTIPFEAEEERIVLAFDLMPN